MGKSKRPSIIEKINSEETSNSLAASSGRRFISLRIPRKFEPIFNLELVLRVSESNIQI